MVIVPRSGDIGGYEVRRALPFRGRRMVGPFVFWDQMGPGEFLTGGGLDVLPHPHIGLSTVTYLFDGEVEHRDSLGTQQIIRAGDVNIMTAGSGIVHSERTPAALRSAPSALFGIQSWLALPKALEEIAPDFAHHGVQDLPRLQAEGIDLRLVMGAGFGLQSPVRCDWETLYADVHLAAGAVLPVPQDIEERAIYALSGEIEIGGTVYAPQQMLVLRPGDAVHIRACSTARLMLLGGAAMDGPRFIYWNFVSSSKERLEEAKAGWRAQRFAKVPGEGTAFVPLPE
ncbi:MAG: pirin family protein [Alphaproteobacteria bacterium]|nr:pirin family protein [Alphaproteobacteria bacterium]